MGLGQMKRIGEHVAHPHVCSVPLTESVGDTSNFGIDGTTPVDFAAGVATGYSSFAVHRILISWQDTGTFRAERFAAFAGELANGCVLEYNNGGATPNVFDGETIKNNADMGRHCYDVVLAEWGAGDNFIMARLSFDKFGGPIVLKGSELLTWRVQDDLTGLVSGFAVAQGEMIL